MGTVTLPTYEAQEIEKRAPWPRMDPSAAVAAGNAQMRFLNTLFAGATGIAENIIATQRNTQMSTFIRTYTETADAEKLAIEQNPTTTLGVQYGDIPEAERGAPNLYSYTKKRKVWLPKLLYEIKDSKVRRAAESWAADRWVAEKDGIARWDFAKIKEESVDTFIENFSATVENGNLGAAKDLADIAISGGIISRKYYDDLMDQAHKDVTKRSIYLKALGMGEEEGLKYLAERKNLRYQTYDGQIKDMPLADQEELIAQWGLDKDRRNLALREAIEQTELNFLDRLQAGDPPTWSEVRNSDLEVKQKEQLRDLINKISEQARKDVEDRLDELKTKREEAEAQKNLEAFDRAYNELIDFPIGREEEWEDRIMNDPLLTGGKGGQKEWFISEYRQRSKEDRETAKKKSPLEVTDPDVDAEVTRAFWNFDKGNDEVKDLVLGVMGKGLSVDDSQAWLRYIEKRETYKSQKVIFDMVSQHFDDILKFESDPDKSLKERQKEAQIKTQLQRAIDSGKLTDDGLRQYAVNMIAEHKDGKVSKTLQSLTVEEPEIKPYVTIETYNREMTDRFTEWSGSPPEMVGEVEELIGGKVVNIRIFSNGTSWFVYRNREWQIFDEEQGKWLTATR